MTTVSHKDLTGADLHEPKGASTAASGTVYVANGSGSGSWTTIAALTGEVGEIKPFFTFSVPSSFLELDGSNVSRTTFSNLFTSGSLQQTGSRTSGSAVISSLVSTSGVVAGQYIGGTGIPLGTTVVSKTSNTITMSANATSTGSSNVIVSIFGLGDGSTTFTLPDATTTQKFFRSRSAGGLVGQAQSNQLGSHTHTGTVDAAGSHNHTGGTDAGGVDHTHGMWPDSAGVSGGGSFIAPIANGNRGANTSGASSFMHTHTFTTNTVGAHQHTFTTNATGSSETRPEAITCIWGIRY